MSARLNPMFVNSSCNKLLLFYLSRYGLSEYHRLEISLLVDMVRKVPVVSSTGKR